jgi:hypothetical protein
VLDRSAIFENIDKCQLDVRFSKKVEKKVNCILVQMCRTMSQRHKRIFFQLNFLTCLQYAFNHWMCQRWEILHFYLFSNIISMLLRKIHHCCNPATYNFVLFKTPSLDLVYWDQKQLFNTSAPEKFQSTLMNTYLLWFKTIQFPVSQSLTPLLATKAEEL